MKTHDFDEAAKLLAFLSPLGKDWQEGRLFRSQFEPDDDGYKLLPSLFRPYGKDSLAEKYYDQALNTLKNGGTKSENAHFGGLYNEPIFEEAIAISYMEQLVLKDFVEKSNNLGIHVPESERMLNKELKNSEFVYGRNLYKLGLLRQADDTYKVPADADLDHIYMKRLSEVEIERPPLFAGLAQHHKAATRLLDFSFNPYKSLFHPVNFVSAQKCSRDNKQGYITTYFFSAHFFSLQFLEQITRDINYERKFMTPTYHLVKMPSSSNHYLYQQEGLFAYAAFPYDHKLLTGEFPSLNDFLSAFEVGPFPTLQRARIPISEFESLKKLLQKVGITKSKLMPNLDNVVEEMRDG